MNTCQARAIIERIADEKRRSLEGGGKDFQGALKRLVGIWSDPSHALVELLQNADDAGATEVEYKILHRGIIFKHNGHSFTEWEVKAICSVDNSTKDVEKHTGFMGVGFKAVFKLSDAPFIFCPPWQFYFSPHGFPHSNWGWVLIPRWGDTILPEIEGTSNGKTVYWLPYKRELSEDVIKQIAGEIFERFDSLCLMFLRNVKQIQIENSDGRIRKLRCEGDTVVEEKDGKEKAYRYKVFRNRFRVPDDAKVGGPIQDSGRDRAIVREIVLAFALDSNGNLQSIQNAPLYTFLPTKFRPNLRFAVQGDFILDTSRSHVDESLEWNRWLFRCIKDLLQGGIEGFADDEGNRVSGFKENEELRYQFYRVLPSKSEFPSTGEKGMIRTDLVEPFWNYCREKSIIITSSNSWVKPSEAVLVSPDITLLNAHGVR